MGQRKYERNRLYTRVMQLSPSPSYPRRFQLSYTIALMSYNFFALWGYGAVFGDALSTYAPVPFLGDAGAYRMYVVLFALVVVPLATMEIKEQAVFQVGLGASGHGTTQSDGALLFWFYS